MANPPRGPAGIEVQHARVYYDPGSRRVVHMHTIVAASGERLDEKRMAAEIAAFEESLSELHSGHLQHLDVAEEELRAASRAGGELRVDAEGTRLVHDEQAD